MKNGPTDIPKLLIGTEFLPLSILEIIEAMRSGVAGVSMLFYYSRCKTLSDKISSNEVIDVSLEDIMEVIEYLKNLCNDVLLKNTTDEVSTDSSVTESPGKRSAGGRSSRIHLRFTDR